MKYINNDAASCRCAEEFAACVEKFCETVRRFPSCLDPHRGINEKAEEIFATAGFKLYSTVKKTTLVYDPSADCFIKVIHPLTIKNRLLSLFSDRGRSVYEITEYLLSKGLKIMKVYAYGTFKKGRLPFFVFRKTEGESLYDILIRGKKTLPMETYLDVVSEVAKLHSSGFWFGDAHLSHIFVKDTHVSGLIDIDGIRKNRPFMLKRLAKDLAGLNHPELPLNEDEKQMIFHHYVNAAGIRVEKIFLRLVKHYTERRWKD